MSPPRVPTRSAPDAARGCARRSALVALAAAWLGGCSAGLEPDAGDATSMDVDTIPARGDAPTTLLVALVDARARSPVAGARCLVASPLRAPIEATTDLRGHARVPLDAWPESLSVVCAKGHVTAVVGLTATDAPGGVVALELPAAGPDVATYVVWGDLRGAAPGTTRLVHASAGDALYVAEGSDRYAVEVEPGRAVELSAIELAPSPRAARLDDRVTRAWSAAWLAPLRSDVRVDLDLGEGAVPRRFARGSLAFATSNGSVLGAPGFEARVETTTRDGGATRLVGVGLGEARLGRLDLASELRTDAALVDAVTRVVLADPTHPTYGRSALWLRGGPPEADLDEALLDQPVVLEPRGAAPLEGARLRWSERGAQAVRFEGCDEPCAHRLVVRWTSGRASVVLPALPSEGVGLEGARVRGVLVAEDEGTGEGTIGRRSESWQLVLERDVAP